MKHIVVAIPAIEDDDLPETLAHLYALSSRRHDITVVVHEQVSQHGRIEPADLPGFDKRRHKYLYVRSDKALGCWPARRGISSYLKAEGITGDYGMTIDSHTRFRSGWDDTYVSLHEAARGSEWLGRPTKDVVLTGAMPTQLWGDSLTAMPIMGYQDDWSLTGFMPLTDPKALHMRAEAPYAPARHYCAHTAFGPFELLHLWQRHRDNILFLGEEHVIPLEIYRAGWGMFHTPLPSTHLALRPPGRPWEDNTEWWRLDEQATAYQRIVLHADIASCSDRCATGRPVCNVEEWQLLTGLDYRAGREVPSAWHRWMEEHYPEALNGTRSDKE